MNEFEKLCQQNQETVYRYLLALCRDEHLAEELTAETFYRAFLHIDRFRGECKVTLAQPSVLEKIPEISR